MISLALIQLCLVKPLNYNGRWKGASTVPPVSSSSSVRTLLTHQSNHYCFFFLFIYKTACSRERRLIRRRSPRCRWRMLRDVFVINKWRPSLTARALIQFVRRLNAYSRTPSFKRYIILYYTTRFFSISSLLYSVFTQSQTRRETFIVTSRV